MADKEIIIRDARLRWPVLFKPRNSSDGVDDPKAKPRYSATLILEPNNPAIKEILAEMNVVAAAKWQDKATKILASLKEDARLCISSKPKKTRDGDIREEFEGKVWIGTGRTVSKGAPLVVDRNLARLTEADGRPYDGCYVNAKITLWAMDHPEYGRRIVADLNTVQFVRDGDAFGGGRAPGLDGLEDLSDEEGAPEMAGADDLL